MNLVNDKAAWFAEITLYKLSLFRTKYNTASLARGLSDIEADRLRKKLTIQREFVVSFGNGNPSFIQFEEGDTSGGECVGQGEASLSCPQGGHTCLPGCTSLDADPHCYTQDFNGKFCFTEVDDVQCADHGGGDLSLFDCASANGAGDIGSCVLANTCETFKANVCDTWFGWCNPATGAECVSFQHACVTKDNCWYTDDCFEG